MDGIPTNNFKSVKEAALTLYDNAPNMAPTKEFIHSAVKFCLLSSIPTVQGQNHKYEITEEGVILASVFGTILAIAVAVGIVGIVYSFLQTCALAETFAHDAGSVAGGLRIRSVSADEDPTIRDIFDEPSPDQTHLRDGEPTSYHSIGTQPPFLKTIDIMSDRNTDGISLKGNGFDI